MNDQDIFFLIWRNRYLQQKVFLSFTDYIIIKNITQLDKKHNHLLSLNQHNIPVVYHLKDLDHYFIYFTSVYLDTTSIDIGAIPNSVKILVLNNPREDIDHDIELKEDFDIKSLPQSLTQLNFNDEYGRVYINLDEMPPNLLYLNLNECKCVINGNENFFNIPESVTQLKFGSFYPPENFNFPSNLTDLSYEYWDRSFKAPINLPPLPRNLKTLNSNCFLTCESKDNFPIGLINYTNTTERINQEKVLIIPDSVKKLVIYNQRTFSELPVIPSTVTYLELKRYYNLFNKQVKQLTNITKLIICFDRNIDYDLLIGLIPPTVTDLGLTYSKPIEKGVIPNSVTKLYLDSFKAVPIYIPNGVTTLTFLDNDQIYPEVEIPSSVRTLGAYRVNFEKFPFHLFPNVTKFWFNKSDYYLEFEEKLEMNFPNYNNNILPSNTRLVKLENLYRYRINYHFIDQKVYKEHYHLANNLLNFKQYP
ncbi:hypothetical protein CYY_000399 [Polysphondylium violaceum]|uniref:FNIP repeat-containing protein n=1 Tax=Polysphondylium violaceum TaxID=133409 RepID=A0A8J4Q3W5_9MYCE|nr:hypothetical protein CYY_000399 [Polysphondylium violaceum]